MTRDNDAPSRIDLPEAPADQRAILDAGGVACWAEDVVIDTYSPGTPDPYPLFLERRVYQGSSGRVYPMPMIDSVDYDKAPRAWKAIHLENEYVRLMLLPEIGGRIHIGYDKVAGYDFFYRNNVIKPALVGLAGPWISGGVEFNWPQHHRPGTFLPVESRIDRESDDSVVVWHTDLDPLQRMRGTHGIRLRGDSSLIEAEVSLHNRTDVPQTFLWWANVAARSHERYQSFFPDDVGYVADHARRAITAFPRADRPYYGVDYPALVSDANPDADRIDIYSNIPVPTSYMITDTEQDFFGGYDHSADAGFVHWADRALSPGKKQWTWGNGPIGRAWDSQLTDADGPYVELMAGVYTDNQPDFSWLMPGETKRFSQYWYPIHRIGPARQATREAAVAVAREGTVARIGLLSTTSRPHVTIAIIARDTIITEWSGPLSPADPTVREFTVPEDVPFRIAVRDGEDLLVAWEPHTADAVEPWVATAPERPDAIPTNDELYLTAVHLTQYRHPSRSPRPYLEEALRRDPADSRAATELAARHLSRGEYEKASRLLEIATTRLTHRNLNPRDGETAYLQGLVFEREGDPDAADASFAKAAWDASWAAPASLARARLALRSRATADAIIHAKVAGDIPEARRIIVQALRLQGDHVEAEVLLSELRNVDPLDPATAALDGSLDVRDPRTPLEVASEFARAGAWDDALRATKDTRPQSASAAFGNPESLRHYLRAMWLDALGRSTDARDERGRAQAAAAEYAFPAGLDQYDALRAALVADPTDGRAHGLLGMWLLDAGRTRDAHTHLRAATDLGSEDPVVWRNLALATVDSGGDQEVADAALLHALTLRSDARLVLERDVLAQVRGLTPPARLALLEEYRELLDHRDDLALLHVTLLLDVGRTEEAWTILADRTFRPFEGGEGRVIAAYDRASCEIARDLFAADPAAAARMLREGIHVPKSLGEGRHPSVPLSERLVLLGDALRAAGDEDGATEAWRKARERNSLAVEVRAADEVEYWVGLAHLRLGEVQEAETKWRALDQRADDLESSKEPADYFATSLPEMLLFDVDTAAARVSQATRLRRLAAHGRSFVAERVSA